MNFTLFTCHQFAVGNLICTLISENQGIEKFSSASDLRKNSVPADQNFFSVHLNFFSVCLLDFFRFIVINSSFFQGGDLEKKIKPEVSLRYEGDLDFLRA